ncbi:MAG: peroxiredoxin family protein [Terriglobales bacterium]
MANTLTGDFDVVAEFSVAAVNRILAAMHQCERFLHSVSGHVDDAPPPPLQGTHPVLTGGVDRFGDPIVEARRLSGLQLQPPGALAATDPAFSILGAVVNPNFGGIIGPIKVTPSNLKGKVQLQLSPPTVDVPDASGKNLTVTMNAMARYFPDKNTAPIAEFIRGDLSITAPVNQITSQSANVVEFDFKADQAVISFTPSFSSKPLSAADRAAISLVIRNALRTSFLPSSASLPSNIAQVQFKTFKSAQKAVGVLLNMSSHAANPASANNLFLRSNDQFAFAAGRDFVLATLKPITDNLLSQPFPPVKFNVSLGLTTLHYSYPVTLKTASFDLKPGKIVLTITGHAAHSNHRIGGPFDFTVTMDFTLQAVGPVVNLIPGNVSLDTTSLVEELVSVFSDAATKSIANARDQALNDSGAFGLVSDMFDMNQRLGPFLKSLLTDPSSNEPPPLQGFIMTYSGVDIQPAGIVLHGLLFCIFQLPGPHVEFEQIISTSGSGGIVGGLGGVGGGLGNDGPDYSALKSWVPGGRIDQYEWSIKYQNKLYPFGVDPNKFVLLHSGPVATEANNGGGGSLPPFTPLCLTVRGTQLSPQGPVVPQAVSATVCGYTRAITLPPELVATLVEAQPMFALTSPSPDGHVVVTGHAAAQAASGGGAAPNVLVHFADAKSATQLGHLTQAVSKRKDVATAVVAVVPPDQLPKMRYNPGVIYADDRDGAWEKTFQVKSKHRPLTLLLNPKGEIVWKQDGPLDQGALGLTLGRHLAPTGNVRVTVSRLAARIGHPAPNFLFEYTSGREMPLSKLRGRPALLVFWKSSSPPSIEAVRDLAAGDANSVVLAINDGEPVEAVRRSAAKNRFSATVVPDPKRDISSAYGVDLWPTIVAVDAAGLITGIRYGYLKGEHADTPVKGKTATPVKQKTAVQRKTAKSSKGKAKLRRKRGAR